MDLSLKEMMDGSAGPWTEELHSSFLNWVEESFVRQVLAVRCAGPSHRDADLATTASRPPPLDRFVPDSATESTRDLGRTARTRRSGGPPAMHDAAEDVVAAGGHGAGRPRRSSAAAGVAGEDEPDGESDVTNRQRTRKRPLESLCSKEKENAVARDQACNFSVGISVGSASSDESVSHLKKATEAGALQAAHHREESG